MLQQRDLETKGGSMRLGSYPCVLKENTLALRVYGKKNINERHRHRYEFNTKYRRQIEEAGLVLSGTSPDGNLVEMVELPNHRWFLASQFHPEFKSRPLECHPMFKSYIRAAIAFKKDRGEQPKLIGGLRVVARTEVNS
jgi:CTP synthase